VTDEPNAAPSPGASTSEDDAAFAVAVARVLAHEGNYQASPDDPGNWTGGKIGAGELKGTNHGISAAQYPELDIARLTAAEATAIYRRDWWDRYGLGRLPAPLAAKLLDAGVNIGMANAVRCLQRGLRACDRRVAEDGMLGPETIAAVIAIAPEILLSALREALAGHYRLIVAQRPARQRFLVGWLARAYS
jgi:lysozyme family protein